MSQVGIIMGSDSDLPKMEDAINILSKFGVSYEVKVSSAHRTLDRTVNWVRQFASEGGQIIIAAAGLAAHLPGVAAAACTLPVIGVPIKSGALEGVDALYAIVQMPPGIPVATVGISAARNAALLAVEILALNDENLRSELAAFRTRLAAEVESKDQQLQDKLNQRA